MQQRSTRTRFLRLGFAIGACVLTTLSVSASISKSPAIRSPKTLRVVLGNEVKISDEAKISAPDLSSSKAAQLAMQKKPAQPAASSLIFDIPVAYNKDVRFWIKYFQGNGRSHFKRWLERSGRYLPAIQKTLQHEGLPKDLAYMAMIESGFSSSAISPAAAVGPWQFIRETGERYGLRVKWWIDERRDFDKSTRAAAKYLKFLYRQFNAWHLAAAGYNAGENYIRRLSLRHGTRSFWTLSQRGSLNDETKNYVPKLIAATLIAKAPTLYGFRDLVWDEPLEYEFTYAPGGTALAELADHLQVTRQHLKEINPELLLGYIPQEIEGHFIRVPKGSIHQCEQFFRRSVALN